MKSPKLFLLTGRIVLNLTCSGGICLTMKHSAALSKQAFTNNPNLNAAAFRIIESRGLVNVAKANYYPVVTVDPSGSKNLLSGNRPSQVSSNQLPILTLNTITLPLDMSYELDVWGKFRRGVESTEATMRATEADQQVIKLAALPPILLPTTLIYV